MFYEDNIILERLNYFCRFERLTFDQLTALSLFKDPGIVSLKKIINLDSHPFPRKYLERYNLIKQGPFSPKFSDGTVFLDQFLKWVIEIELEVPEELIRSISKRGKIKESLINVQDFSLKEINNKLTQEINDLKKQVKTLTNSVQWPNNGDIAEMNADQALAIMGWLISEKNTKYTISGRPNAAQIAASVNERAIQFFGDENVKLASFQKRLSKALNLFDEEKNTVS